MNYGLWIMMDTTTPVIPTGARAFLAGGVEESVKERRMIQSAVPMVTDSSTPLRSARNDGATPLRSARNDVQLRSARNDGASQSEIRNQ
jgi:hypothetical protein